MKIQVEITEAKDMTKVEIEAHGLVSPKETIYARAIIEAVKNVTRGLTVATGGTISREGGEERYTVVGNG